MTLLSPQQSGVGGLPVSQDKRVFDSILGAIGNTPLVKLGRIGRDLPVPLYAKLEFMNPGGSVKDRVGANIIEQAEKRGELKPGGTIVEATSGNTGVGLAIAAALKGYKTIFVMPDKMSNEKILLLRAYGAKVVITPTEVGPDDPRSYYEVAKRFARETPKAILANQYHNPDNPLTHEKTTGPELWNQTDGRADRRDHRDGDRRDNFGSWSLSKADESGHQDRGRGHRGLDPDRDLAE